MLKPNVVVLLLKNEINLRNASQFLLDKIQINVLLMALKCLCF